MAENFSRPPEISSDCIERWQTKMALRNSTQLSREGRASSRSCGRSVSLRALIETYIYCTYIGTWARCGWQSFKRDTGLPNSCYGRDTGLSNQEAELQSHDSFAKFAISVLDSWPCEWSARLAEHKTNFGQCASFHTNFTSNSTMAEEVSDRFSVTISKLHFINEARSKLMNQARPARSNCGRWNSQYSWMALAGLFEAIQVNILVRIFVIYQVVTLNVWFTHFSRGRAKHKCGAALVWTWI